jgi:hypothetical protein
MTKKKISHICDKLFWGFLMILPLLVYLVYIIKNGNIYPLEQVFTDFGFGIDTSSIIYQTFTSIFGVVTGSTANIPAFLSNGVILYITYIVLIEIIHLIVDILLYIPRIAMKFLDKGVE